jgi:hypothetical protein
MFTLFSYGFFFVLGYAASQYDYNNITSRLNDVRTLYNSTFDKEKCHVRTIYKVSTFLSTTYFEQIKRYVKHQLYHYNHVSLNNNKVLYTVQVNNKTRFLPICSTQTQVPDVMEIKFEKDENNIHEKLNEMITTTWLQDNLMSILSIHKTNNTITPCDLGLKSLSLTILNEDIETFTFNKNDEIKLYK